MLKAARPAAASARRIAANIAKLPFGARKQLIGSN
jgi:hypothetical protein